MNSFLTANAAFSKFSRNYMQHKRDLPIRPSEMGVLNIITQTPGPHTSVQLAEMIGVSKPMIAAHLSVLLEKGYITKQQSTDDKRVFFILPTEKAHELVSAAKKDADELLEMMLRKMGENEFNALVALVERANNILEAEDNGSER